MEDHHQLLYMYLSLHQIHCLRAKIFFSIYEEHEKVLGPDLVNKYEISLTPGQKEIYQASMSPKTEYLGIVAAFRDIENSNWRQVIKVDKTGYNTYQISLEDLSLVVQ